MKPELPPHATVVSLRERLDVRRMKYCGERQLNGTYEYFRDTPIGRVGATESAHVAIDHMLLTAEEARKLAQDLMHVAYRAERRERTISGGQRVLVTIDTRGRVLVSRRHLSCWMRLSQLRQPRACSTCKGSVRSLWIRDMKESPYGPAESYVDRLHVELCEPCVAYLAAIPRELRRVFTSADEHAGEHKKGA